MKVLVVSNNCFSKSQNMGKTLTSIFSKFDKMEICQLFFYSSIPDSMVCEDFFRISDYDLLKGKLWGNIGQVVMPKSDTDSCLYENNDVKKAYSRFNRNQPLVALARTLLWDIAHWNSKELNEWILRMKPDCIFFASGDTVFSYKIVSYISKKYQIPVISYVCDEFFEGYKAKGVLGHIYHKNLKKHMRKMFKNSKKIAVICEPLGELYKKNFGCEYIVLNTGTAIENSNINIDISSNEVSYLGNIGLNRWQSLIEVGEALENLNKKYSKNYVLNIYSGEKNEIILNKLKSVDSICFKGRVAPEVCLNIIRNSSAVLHTESFEIADINRVKYSMSTKIADSLASGTCLFAYGSSELASIQYLIKYDCAAVATSIEELEAKLFEVLENEEKRKEYVLNAIKIAKKNHDSAKNSIDFHRHCLELTGMK